jgi:transglutaminase-like putative cysteine protease
MADWVRDAYASILAGSGRVETLDLLCGLNSHIGRTIAYQPREVEGTQTPSETLALGSGSCRDFALLFMEAARQLGIAARFVTGYLVDAMALDEGGMAPRGGGATHAWAQVYVPGLGWVEFDPTNQIVGSNQLIRVAVTRDPTQAVPIAGSYTGPTGALTAMRVDVSVSVVTG